MGTTTSAPVFERDGASGPSKQGRREEGGTHEKFQKIAQSTAKVVGKEAAFGIAAATVVIWAALGPIFHFSDTWQLVINTSTTIVTFLMVFLIQATQNRDARAVQLKLDELIRAKKNARNALSCLEEASEEELDRFEQEFKGLRQRSRSERVEQDALH